MPRAATADAPQSLTAAPRAQKRPAPERPTRFTETSKSVVNADGTTTTTLYSRPAFRREGARWLPIEPRLRGSSDDAAPFEVTGGAVPVRIGTGRRPLLELGYRGGAVTLAPTSFRTVGTGVRGGGRVRFTTTAADTDVTIQPVASGLRVAQVIRSSKSPTRFRYRLSDPGGVLGDLVEERDGSFRFTGPSDGQGLRIEAPFAYELGATPATPFTPGSAHHTIVKRGDGYDIEEWVDAGWLARHRFPIVLDPSITLTGPSGNTDCHIASSTSAGNTYCGGTYVEVGAGTSGVVRRPLLQFPYDAIPAGSTISAATLNLGFASGTAGTATSATVGALRVKAGELWTSPNWAYRIPSTSTAWSAAGGGFASPSVSTRSVSASTTANTRLTWDVTSVVTTQFPTTPNGQNPGILLKVAQEAESVLLRFHSVEHTTASHRPQLAVTYTAPAAPVASASAGDTAARVTWTPGTDNGSRTGFLVRAYRADTGAVAATVGVGPTDTVADITGLANLTGYYFGVRATYPDSEEGAEGLTATVTPHAAPQVASAIETAGRSVGFGTAYAAGDELELKVTVTNRDTVTAPISLSAELPTTSASGSVEINGQSCSAPVTCTFAANGTGGRHRLSVTGLSLAAGAGAIVTVDFVPDISARNCLTASIAPGAIVATNTTDGSSSISNGSPTAPVPLHVCDSGLGFENWWSYEDLAVGGAGRAAVNIGTGNLVLQQTDTTPVQIHGRLALLTRRTYNSQDAGLRTLPGSVGDGWTLNLGDVGEVTGTLTAGSALVVPPLSAVIANPGPLTLVDRDGTRHRFSATKLTPVAPAVTGLAAAGAPLSAAAPTGQALCVDASYQPPPGVQLSVWRYVISSGSSCATSNSFTLGGFVSLRPDRLRAEYNALGRLTALLDGAGNQVDYAYDVAGRLITITEKLRGAGTPRRVTLEHRATVSTDACAGSPWQVRIIDPAARATAYCLSAEPATSVALSYLDRVVNPDGSVIRYTYQGVTPAGGTGPASCTGAESGQLCSVSNQRSAAATASTTFTYTSATGDGGGYPYVGSVTNRAGDQTTYTYDFNASPALVDSDRGNHRTRYTAIDAYGRVGEVQQGTADATVGVKMLRNIVYAWDTTGTGARRCRQGDDQKLHHEMCAVTRKAVAVSEPYKSNFPTPPDEVTEYLYNAEGQPLRVRQDSNGAAAGGAIDTTYGYWAQYVNALGQISCYQDAVTGLSAVTASAPASCGSVTNSNAGRGVNTLFVLSDRTQMLTPRGNLVSPNYDLSINPYRSTFHPDNDSGVAPNVTTSGICGDAPDANSGLLCQHSSPLEDEYLGVELFRYDGYGQLIRWTDRGAVATRYWYADDADRDLSGTTPAGGWLQRVDDPTGWPEPAARTYAAFAYDAAGNVVRTWDRNATKAAEEAATAAGTTISIDDYSSRTAPPSLAYREMLYAPLPDAGATSYSRPWRYLASESDSLVTSGVRAENRTTYTSDYNGNPLSVTPPRGNSGFSATGSGIATSVYTTDYTYDAMDRLTKVQRPAESGSTDRATVAFFYDQFGNVDYETGPLGQVVDHVYDDVNRPRFDYVKRGGTDATLKARSTGCDSAASWPAPAPAPAPIAADDLVCRTPVVDHDGRDVAYQTTRTGNLNAFTVVDGARRVTATVDERVHKDASSPGEWLWNRFVHDADGNVIRACSPRDTAEGGDTTCAAPVVYGVEMTYDASGDMRTETTRRDATTQYQTVYQYDYNNQITFVTHPNGAETDYTYDLRGRLSCVARTRDAATWVRKWYQYDYVGNKTSESRFDATACPTPSAPPSGGTVTKYTYDTSNRLTEVVDAEGGNLAASGGSDARTRYEYDADGNVITTYAPRAFANGSTPSGAYATRTEYDRAGRPVARFTPRTDPATPPPALQDAALEPVTTQDDECPTDPRYPANTRVCVTRTGYDLAGRVLRTWFPTAGGSTTSPRHLTYEYTTDGLLWKTIAPAPHGSGATSATTTRYYDSLARPVVTLDAAGATTTTSYTGDGLVAEVIAPANGALTHKTSVTYDTNGNLRTHTAPSGLVTSNTFYADDLLQKSWTPNDRAATATTSAYDPAGDVRSYVYDAVGNVTKVHSPAANAAGTPHADATASVNVPTVNTYTRDNLLLTTVAPVSPDGKTKLRRTTYSYELDGQQKEQRVEYVQDTAANVGSYTVISGTPDVQQLEYYPNDRLKRRTGTGAGVTSTVEYKYDLDGNLLSADTGTAADLVTAAYYPDGLVARADAGSRRTAYLYDGGGRVAARADAALVNGAPGTYLTTAYTYDDAGLPVRMRAPDAVTTGTVNGPKGETTWQYDVAGRATSMTAPNDAVTGYTWSADGTLQSQSTAKSATDPILLAAWNYTYDSGYRVKTAQYSGKDAGGAVAATTATYGYSRAGRIQSFQLGSGDVQYYEWDHNGNRTCAGDGCGHDSTPASLIAPKTTFSYNADDSIATETRPGAAARTYAYARPFGGMSGDGCNTMSYDGFFRLSSSTQTTTGGTGQCPTTAVPSTSATFDGLGRVRSRTTGTATTTLNYDGLSTNVVRESSTSTVQYTLDPRGAVTSLLTGSQLHFLVADGGGSVTNVLTAAGAVACAVRYDPFGAMQSVTGSGASSCTSSVTKNSRWFRGARLDETTGQYRLGSRTYDPAKSAFLEPDSPMSAGSPGAVRQQIDPLTANRYSYVNGDPVNYADPTGHVRADPEGPMSEKALKASCESERNHRDATPENAERRVVGCRLYFGLDPTGGASDPRRAVTIVVALIGFVPVVGEIADGFGCGASLASSDRDWTEIGINCGAMAPFLGTPANVVKLGRALENVDNLNDAARAVSNAGDAVDEVMDVARRKTSAPTNAKRLTPASATKQPGPGSNVSAGTRGREPPRAKAAKPSAAQHGAGTRTTILGENMKDRVEPFANATGARTLGFGTTDEQWHALTWRQKWKLNDGQLRARIREGDDFRYIGPDEGRTDAQRLKFDLTGSELLRLDERGVPYETVSKYEVRKTIGRW
ncbi:MAG TPA: DNRLRE domain-containing protein [Frankiaceae bacterium]|nr:DNRLRE domain-containing protein [Frankiaceae bacterium]